MNLNLTDKVVFVAGSSKGIGKGIAKAFLHEGANVVLTGRNGKNLQNTYQEFSQNYNPNKILVFEGDLQEAAQIKKAIQFTYEKWNKINCLVANIGSGKSVMDNQIGMQEWDRVFKLNYFCSVQLTEEVLPKMMELKQGNIIFISSIAGIENLNAPLPYSAAKSALIHYSKNISKRVGQFNIRVNCIAPGNILFKGGTWEKKLEENTALHEAYINQEVSLRKFGSVEDIANAALFLASEKASFITGTCLIVDGGQTKSI